jgi:AraC-like DNA-binding protein
MKAAYEHISAGERASFAFRSFAVPGFGFNWHFHPEYELTLIARGSGKRFVGDHIDDYVAGDLVLLGPNLPHTWYSQPARPVNRKAQKSVVVQFLQGFMGESFFDRPEMVDIGRLLQRSSRGLQFAGKISRSAASQMLEMERLGPLERLTALLSILHALSRCRDCTVLSSERYAPTLRSSEQQRIDAVCSFLNERYAEPIRLEDAAELACLSISAFSRLFRRASGKTFTGYLNELRIGAACHLLTETDRRVSDIAFESGFENLSNFNRRFLEIKRMTPREYRRQFESAAAMV